MELKDKLIELRNKKGLSQIAAAEALDVSRQAISRWETGASAPSTENLIELSRLYGVPIDELVNGGVSCRAESGAEAATAAAPHRASPRRRLAAALALALLAAVIGAYMLGRGERDEIITGIHDEIVDANDMDEREIPNFEDIGVVPWGE